MSRPDPIQYAERLYAAIVAANFSAVSFLAFGNAVKDGVELRRIPRIAAEPFMRVVGEMLHLEDRIENAEIIEAASEQGAAQIAAADLSPNAGVSAAEQLGQGSGNGLQESLPAIVESVGVIPSVD
jgi:hypothetical protein